MFWILLVIQMFYGKSKRQET